MAKTKKTRTRTKNNEINITFSAIFTGIIGAVLVSASSFYIVLKFGALPWPTIMVTLLSMMTLNFFKKANKLIRKRGQNVFYRLRKDDLFHRRAVA